MKPIFRWTIGPVMPLGFKILFESINKTMKSLGEDSFEWIVNYNCLGHKEIASIRRFLRGKNIKLIRQRWKDFPLPLKWQRFYPHAGAEGSIWKICPPRRDLFRHEIIMDNDVVLLEPIEEINQFLNSNRTLMLAEPKKYYGYYEPYLPAEPPYYNSGLMGFPPGYDWGDAIKTTWENYGEFCSYDNGDEQGLLMLALMQSDPIIIPKETIIELHPNELSYKQPSFDTILIKNKQFYNFKNMPKGMHFVRANRTGINSHTHWNLYKEAAKKSIIL